jgi:isochorismate pyruvate lyase
MNEVRAGVDALDQALVILLAERQRYMDAAARIKTDRAAVRDQDRIEAVIGKVRAAARDAGLSDSIAEPVWRILIERSIAHELAAWDAARAAGGRPHAS